MKTQKTVGEVTKWPPLRWRMARIREQLTELWEKYEPLIDAAPDEDAQDKLEGDWQGNSWELYEELNRLVTQLAVRRANRWHVTLPERNRLALAKQTEHHNWELTPNFGYEVLTLRARQRLEEDIWR